MYVADGESKIQSPKLRTVEICCGIIGSSATKSLAELRQSRLITKRFQELGEARRGREIRKKETTPSHLKSTTYRSSAFEKAVTSRRAWTADAWREAREKLIHQMDVRRLV